LLNCADPDCRQAGGGGPPPTPTGAGLCEVIEASCEDTFDNDGDGDIDCKDQDCVPLGICKNRGGCALSGPVTDIGSAIAGILVPMLPIVGIGIRRLRRRLKK